MVNEIINHLYEITHTPASGADNFTMPALQDAVSGLLSPSSRPSSYPDFQDEDIRKFVVFVLRMIDAPPNLHGILNAEGCLKHLIELFLQEATGDAAIRTQFLSLLDRLFYYLHRSVPSDLDILRKRPLIKNSPLLAFHVAAFGVSIEAHKNYPLYRAYGHKFHLVIRDLRHKNPTQSYYESAVRAARYYFVFMSPDILALPAHPDRMPKKYISIFLAKLKEKLKSDDIAALMKIYDRIFMQLLKRSPVRRRKRSHARTKKKKKTAHGGTDALVGEIADATFEPETEEDIEFLSKYDFIRTDSSDIVVTKKPHLSRSYMDVLNTRNHHPWWDKQCLKLDELHAIYAACVRYWGKYDQYDRIIIYLLILLHYGLDPDTLLRLACDGSRAPHIGNFNGHLYLVIEPPIKPVEDKDPALNCHETSNLVYVPIPLKLARLIQPRIKQNILLFDYMSSDGQSKHLDHHHISQFINKCINEDTGYRITISRIQSSFPILYSERFSLDPIYSCYASGSVVFGLYQSQLHYIYVEARCMADEYLKAFERLDSRIIDNPYTAKDREALCNLSPENANLFICKDSSEVLAVLPAAAYGSKKVPKRSAMRGVVENLKSAIAERTSVVFHHNLFACYAYLCIEFAGGMRPKKPDQNSIYLLRDYRSVIVRDKHSPLFFEERLVWLPDTAAAVISRLDLNFPKLRILLAASINSQLLSMSREHIFFFLDESGNKLDFTLERFRECLEKAGIQYAFPDNAPRHNVKTHFHRSRISMEISDSWCGHSRSGRESLNLASCIIPAETFQACRKVLEDMLIDLGFADIPYLGERF